MNQELQYAVTVFRDLEDKGNQFIVDTDHGRFSFFKTKKDGGDTKARETLRELKPQEGMPINIAYKVNGQYKNAMSFSRPRENDYPSAPIRREDPQVLNEALTKLAENQSKMVAKIQDLEKRLEGLEGLVRTEKGDDAVEFHQSFDSKKNEMEGNDSITLEDVEKIMNEL